MVLRRPRRRRQAQAGRISSRWSARGTSCSAGPVGATGTPSDGADKRASSLRRRWGGSGVDCGGSAVDGGVNSRPTRAAGALRVEAEEQPARGAGAAPDSGPTSRSGGMRGGGRCRCIAICGIQRSGTQRREARLRRHVGRRQQQGRGGSRPDGAVTAARRRSAASAPNRRAIVVARRDFDGDVAGGGEPRR